MERTCRNCARVLAATEFYTKDRNCCKDCAKKRVYARRDRIQAAGFCIMCRSPDVNSGTTCDDCKKKNLQRYHDNQEDYCATARNRRHRLKKEVIEAYSGGVCDCCGEHRLEFLTIDHVHNDGAEHRRALAKESGWKTSPRSMSGSHMYFWLKNNGFPGGFQVLCANCNTGKSNDPDHLCPHERERLAATDASAISA